ncbi:TetR family transcriptional regulator [Nocardioides sp. R-C-SC26]|uniref:TetR family transcriptional regulator n=1 Tax=Nocardioides sp. R-C-SC26 TaxID=2870414 RepID=UPI001E2F26F9|nr:TetR family transcriptional regulator [Nocardioides sp. R-C-SC26]
MSSASTITTSNATASTSEEAGSAAQRDRRKRILDATFALATEGGFDAVQMRAVAEKADVALGTLYRYFPSKVHLLVSALARVLERTETNTRAHEVPGDTSADRVIFVMKRITRGMQGDPRLTEALTRAFMFADASVAQEIHVVGTHLTSILTHAIRPDADEATPEDVVIARVIGDVWLSALVAWVTGRSTAAQTGSHLETAIALLLRD